MGSGEILHIDSYKVKKGNDPKEVTLDAYMQFILENYLSEFVEKSRKGMFNISWFSEIHKSDEENSITVFDKMAAEKYLKSFIMGDGIKEIEASIEIYAEKFFFQSRENPITSIYIVQAHLNKK